jgi:hypothetical protein
MEKGFGSTAEPPGLGAKISRMVMDIVAEPRQDGEPEWVVVAQPSATRFAFHRRVDAPHYASLRDRRSRARQSAMPAVRNS